MYEVDYNIPLLSHVWLVESAGESGDDDGEGESLRALDPSGLVSPHHEFPLDRANLLANPHYPRRSLVAFSNIIREWQ